MTKLSKTPTGKMRAGKLSNFRPPGRGGVFSSITAAIGNTPIVRLGEAAAGENLRSEILLKLEFFNPLLSVKDRIGEAMIADMAAKGRIGENTVVVEPTSGNTGIALAFVCAARGIKLILSMPESMSLERRKMLALLGAQLELTPAADGMRGAIARAEELCAELPDAVMPQQFSNPANPAIHMKTTAEEVWNDTGGEVDAIVCGIGTGGTFTGVGRVMKQRRPGVKMIAVEPEDSPVLSGGKPGPHKIQGIGAGFIPDNMDTSLIDDIVLIGNETAFTQARALAKAQGIACGISSGAALAAGLEVARREEMAGKRILIFLPSAAERYISTALFGA